MLLDVIPTELDVGMLVTLVAGVLDSDAIRTAFVVVITLSVARRVVFAMLTMFVGGRR
jgi:hypothetical protein